MATIQQRPFSKNYSGLINQSVIAACIFTLCITSHALMRRKRRGRGCSARKEDDLGSVETWEFGYLFQGRSWARKPSPPLPRGFPLGWIKQAVTFPEDRFNELRGVDASVYIRFLRGCFWFTFMHTLTTLPILLPIHVTFSDDSVSPKSMTRASISSLAATSKGLSLLWIHLLLLIWITGSWIYTLCWICLGAFKFRSQKIQEAADTAVERAQAAKNAQWTPHPHPQYPFQSVPPLDEDGSDRGLRLRTVMISNLPPGLRSEKELKEYIEYYLSRPIAKPSVGVPTTTQPGFLNTTFAFMFNRAKRVPNRLYKSRTSTEPATGLVSDSGASDAETQANPDDIPAINRVVLVRKMSDLASLLERREEALRCLETAHIRLAQKALTAVKEAMEAKPKGMIRSVTQRLSIVQPKSTSADVEKGGSDDGTAEGEDRMQLLIRTLGPYVQSANAPPLHRQLIANLLPWSSEDLSVEMKSPVTDASTIKDYPEKTVWQALLSLPRSTLDAYQPLIHLSALFRGKTVPSIDYYTAKLNLLTSLITEKRTKAVSDYTPMNTAFVTFVDPADARRACKYLAVHPNNPLACMITMAPQFEDLDWNRLMKSTFKAEFVKDWVINTGVWAFTILWLFPVSIFVGLVSIQNISAFWPGLKQYLDQHEWEEEILQSFIPTLLVSGLSILIPLLLLLIAKKAHTISTLSVLHDRILTRYYKFLVVNVLVFFCVGTVALQAFLLSFKHSAGLKLIQVVSDSFPSAGPFYVGWLIFTTAMHGGFELGLYGLPLLVYPTTKRQVTPRKRAVGIRPRTFNYYYWLPNHLLVIHVLLVFSILNPLVIPFGFLYFCVEIIVIRNQLLHVYAKNYEGNGQNLLIRLVRYSLDGLVLSQVVFMAYMVVLKKTANVAVSAILILLTAMAKMTLTRICRARYERDDILEADIICGTARETESPSESVEILETPAPDTDEKSEKRKGRSAISNNMDFWTMKLASKIRFSYATIPTRPHRPRHQQNPFQFHSGHLSVSMDPTPGLPSTSAAQHNFPGLPMDEKVVEREPTELCSPHPPHPTWDDESSPDHGYENPYYCRIVSDVLWLPRDPLGILDLDDTVDLRMSITSEPGAGKLGSWSEDDFIGSTLSLPSALSSLSFPSFDDDDDSDFIPASRIIHGDEVINLPAGIASRVSHLEKEHDIEETNTLRRPSIMRHRTSSTVNSQRPSSRGNSPHLTFRRPSRASIASLLLLSAGVRAGTTIWSGSFNPYPTVSDFDDWSWSNEVGTYQWYIHGTGPTSDYLALDPSYKNPADTAETNGLRVTIDSTATWNSQMERTELIPQTTQNLGQGNLFYHFSLMRSDTDAPDDTLEHQVMFFESHFTEMKYGVGPTTTDLQWMVQSQWQWGTPFTAGTWFNFAYDIDFSGGTVGLWASTGSAPLTKVVQDIATSPSTNSEDWHVGVLRIVNTQPPEDWYISGVYIESGPITTSVGTGNGTAPPVGPTSAPTTAPSTGPTTIPPPPPPTTTAPGPTQTQYGQCGGTGYTGPTVCASNFQCIAVSPPYYYQCQ
ncbi:hypothetical protein EUX98_g8009 [Antrodiella citrinella]|uniref:CBM1 domain-containing protein n=1 Tax=Antrodiella citrinella TaxID=2447956 RepID=A0A4S4MJ11_9APHY|nr:hypothetical protein EUX98_g8009 [Antrodiella citrinella]